MMTYVSADHCVVSYNCILETDIKNQNTSGGHAVRWAGCQVDWLSSGLIVGWVGCQVGGLSGGWVVRMTGCHVG